MMNTKTLETESNESLTITNTINKQINKFMKPEIPLLTWKDMPEHLQFNPYVHTGRKMMSETAKLAKIIDWVSFFSSCVLKVIDRFKMSKDA